MRDDRSREVPADIADAVAGVTAAEPDALPVPPSG
jgi:hypothetical protein